MGTIISAEDLDKLDDTGVEPVVKNTDVTPKPTVSAPEIPTQEQESLVQSQKALDPQSVAQESEMAPEPSMPIATGDEVKQLDKDLSLGEEPPKGMVVSAEQLDAMDGDDVNYEEFDEANLINKSPLGFFERSALSYSTDKGKEQYLTKRFGKDNIKKLDDESKYAVRQKDGKWYREDPTIGASFRFTADAMKEMVADIVADNSAEAVRLTGQATGAGLGATAGVPLALPSLGTSIASGAVLGGGVGRGMAQGIVELAGKLNGMRPDTTLQDAFVEMGRQATYGSGSEVLGPYAGKMASNLISGPGKLIASGMQKVGSKLSSAVNRNAAFADFVDSFWGGVTGVPKESVKRMRELGKSVINNPKYRDIEQTVEPILINGTKALDNYEQEASKQYMQMTKQASKTKVFVMEVYDAMRGALRGKINPLTGTRTANVASPAEGKDLDKLAEYYSGMLQIKGLRVDPNAAGKVSFIKKGQMTLGQLKSMITDIDDRIAQWSAEGASYMARSGREVRHALTQILHKNPDYLKADNEFQAVIMFMKSLNLIDKNMSGIDKFLKNYSVLPPWIKSRLWKLENSLPQNQKFLEEGLTMAAANVWNELGKLNFSSLAQLGLGRYFGGNLGLGLAFLVRNPKLLQKYVFGAFEKSPEFVRSAATGAGKVSELATRAGVFLETNKIGKTIEEGVRNFMPKAEASEGETLGAKNNNPFNLRGSDKWQGKTGKDKQGHIQFDSLENGVRAGIKNLKNHAAKNPNQTLEQYMNSYAEENGTEEAKYIAGKLGVEPSAKLKDLNMEEVAKPLAMFESKVDISQTSKKKVQIPPQKMKSGKRYRLKRT
jgi:hypothetical protein